MGANDKFYRIMGFQKIDNLLWIIFILLSQVQSQCTDIKWKTTVWSPEEVEVSHSTVPLDDDDAKYSLHLHLSWSRPKPNLTLIDFDGYAVSIEVRGEGINKSYSCDLDENGGLYYTNETEMGIEIKFNYEYHIEFHLASKKLNQKTVLTGIPYDFNGADCYQETGDHDFCITQDAQYVSAPVDVRVENITRSSTTNYRYEMWMSMFPPASVNSDAIMCCYSLTIISTFDETTNDFDRVNVDTKQRIYFNLSRNFTKYTPYVLTAVVYADVSGEQYAKPSLESSFEFQLQDFLREKDGGNSGHTGTVTGSINIYYTLVIPVLIGAILFATSVILLGFYTRRQRIKAAIPQFKREPDDNFIKSAQDYFEYREVDPLFAKKEFDRDMLKIEEELGSGQFGVVCKGYACGIDGGNDYIPVAVKSLKGHASRSMKEYFLDEIRLIIEIGSHPNILGILGCCTIDEPYYLITEFMHYGDLFHFLLKCREAKFALEDPIFHLVYQNQVQIARQIARGMDYLSSTRYYHGDLAARNILVGQGLTIKISDFGLADDIYQSDYKHLAPDRKRPVKWVSLETNLQGICTIQSDVWSFGIVLYEIATLGGMPYPGMQSIEVVERLKEGYRMEQPDNCSNEWYQMMLECWTTNPSKRPKFSELYSRLDIMLVDDAVDYMEPLDGDVNQIVSLEDDLALGTSARSYTPASSEDAAASHEVSEAEQTDGNEQEKECFIDNMSKHAGTDSAFYDDIGFT
ncbi:ephrin type-B receptor 2-like [Anneissia japonica]|uniref:ephrin type-B receptor 2-like n=1 Tax=Anneissia japonica TaxID=1529436 RepID=UPI0014256DFB|nr:ephrin type-B receptor 2-like [Anneissia japonica]